MIKRITTALLCGAVLQPLAQANEVDNRYFTAFANYHMGQGDVTPSGTNIAADPDFPTGYDSSDGLGLGFGAGYHVSDAIRLELNFGYRNSEADDTRTGTGATRDGFNYRVELDSDLYTLGLDAYYDIHTATTIKPYLKAGIGATYYETSGSIVSDNDPFFPEVLAPGGFLNGQGKYPYEKDSGTNFTYAIGAGLSLPMGNDKLLFAEYQYMNVGDISTAADPFTDAFGIDDFGLHELTVGLRF